MSDSSENEQELGTTNDSIVTSGSNSISEHQLSDIDSDDEIDSLSTADISISIPNDENTNSSLHNTSVSNTSTDSLVDLISVENNYSNSPDDSDQQFSNESCDLSDTQDTPVSNHIPNNEQDANEDKDESEDESEEDEEEDEEKTNEVGCEDEVKTNEDLCEDEVKTDECRVEFALTKNTLKESEQLNNLDEKDKNFLNSIVNKYIDTENSNTTPFTNDLFNIIFSSVPLKKYIESLIHLYDEIKYDHIYVSTKYQIAIKIANLFKTVPIQRYFSKDFLKDELVDYLIRKHLFYDNILSTLLIRNWGVQHFNFKPSVKHITFYKVCCQKLTTRLNLFLQTSNYYSFRHSDFITYINFIQLMVKFTDDLDEEDGKSLFSSLSKLLFIILGQLYTIISTSRNTLESLDLISDNYLKRYINRSASDNQSRLIIEIGKCNDTINHFFLVNNLKFTSLFCDYLNDFDYINHTTHPYHSEITALLPFLSNKWYKYKSNYPEIDGMIDTLVDKIYTLRLVDIFKNDKVNVHTKVKILSDSSWKIFSNEKIIISLIEYYSEIEKYDENSGFYEKELIRFHIVRCILEYIKPTEPIRYRPEFLHHKYHKNLVELDKTDDKMLIFDKIDSHKLCSFITLLISEVTENFVILETSIKAIRDTERKMVTHIYKVVNSFDNIVMIYELLSMLVRKKNIHNSFIINKFCELFSTIFNSSFKNRLYCHFKQFTQSSLNDLTIFSDYFTEKIHTFFYTFFNDIRSVTYNQDFIEGFVDNDSLYDRKCLENTEKLVGFINYNSSNLSVSHVLNRFMVVIDKKIYARNQTVEKYDEDIPVDFVDPIYYTPIQEPIEMPNTKTIVEKKIIMNHLVFNQTNPFDGLPLTREEIIEYNKTEEVKERLLEFKRKFDKWKIDHKIE